MKRLFAVIVATGSVFVAAVPSYAQDAQAEKGMQVFVAQKCNVCHSIAGKGKKTGPLDDVGSRLTAAEIKNWINDPIAMAAKRTPKSTRKPPMKKKPLSPADVDSLVALLSSLKK
jgi:cytochrome c2